MVDLKQLSLNEAVRIGEDILRNALADADGLCWKTFHHEKIEDSEETVLMQKVNENIYNGTSGILLFLLELYKHTGNDIFKKAVLDGGKWLLHYTKNEETSDYSFICGRTGSLYVLNTIGNYFDCKEFVEASLIGAKKSWAFINNSKGSAEYLNGIAGTLWGLLLIYTNNPEEWILSYLKEGIILLLNKIRVYKKGIYWDRVFYEIRGLCGFSHGTSGISALFIELSDYFENPLFRAIAKKGFYYENLFFNSVTGQWPDFRKPAFRQAEVLKNEEEYLLGNLAHFNTPVEMSAWCHGNIGIHLAHASAHHKDSSLLSLSKDKYAMKKHMERNDEHRSSKQITFTLCHGAGGNMEVFLPPFSILKSKKADCYLNETVENLLTCKGSNGSYRSGYATHLEEDHSLFIGNSGIGYFLLRYVNPSLTSSILYPPLKRSDKIDRNTLSTNINKDEFSKILLKSIFKRTYVLLEKLNYPIHKLLLEIDFAELDITLIKIEIRKFVAAESGDQLLKKEILKTLSYELHRIKMDENINSILLYTQSRYRNNQFLDKSTTDKKIRYQINETLKIFKLIDPDSLKRQIMLIIPKYNGVEEIILSALEYELLKVFKIPNTIENAIRSMTSQFELNEFLNNRRQIEYRFIEVITSLINIESLVVI